MTHRIIWYTTASFYFWNSTPSKMISSRTQNEIREYNRIFVLSFDIVGVSSNSVTYYLILNRSRHMTRHFKTKLQMQLVLTVPSLQIHTWCAETSEEGNSFRITELFNHPILHSFEFIFALDLINLLNKLPSYRWIETLIWHRWNKQRLKTLYWKEPTSELQAHNSNTEMP